MKSIQAFLFLIVFITPQVSNHLHAILHSHSDYCYETKMHIHEKHISCKYHDYISVVFDLGYDYTGIKQQPNFIIHLTVALIAPIYTPSHFCISERGPPMYV